MSAVRHPQGISNVASWKATGPSALAEAATRFSITHPAMGTILVGMATPDEFEGALAAVQKGPLPQAALDRLAALTAGFVGESR